MVNIKKIIFTILFIFALISPLLSVQIKTGTYTGDGNATKTITGVNFQADALFIYSAANKEATFKTSDMPTVYSLMLTTAANNPYDNWIRTLDADGFTVGSSSNVNGNGNVYYYIAFKDNGIADFAVGSYTGDGNDNREITGFDFDPNCVIIGLYGVSLPVWHTTATTTNYSMFFSANVDYTHVTAKYFYDLITDGFKIGTGTSVNTNAATYYYVVFKNIEGLIDFGKFTGDGNDNTNISGVGFQSNAVIIKADDTESAIGKNSQLSGDAAGYFISTASAANLIQSLDADGFQVGSLAAVNSNGNDVRYAAFKDGASTASTGRTVSIIMQTINK